MQPVSLTPLRQRIVLVAAVLAACLLAWPASPAAAGAGAAPKPTVVLVHGTNTDSSAWHGVTLRLQRDGYRVIAAAMPLRSVAGDAAYLGDLVASIEGDVVLVGHSSGGFLISVAGATAPNARSLVVIDGHLPEVGETAGALTTKFGSAFPTAISTVPFTRPDGTTGQDIYFQADKYRSLFTGPTVSRRDALALAATQRPVAASALDEPATAAAWKTLPTWYVLGTKDKLIPPRTQRFMAERANARITEVPAAHASIVVFPGRIAKVIERAAG